MVIQYMSLRSESENLSHAALGAAFPCYGDKARSCRMEGLVKKWLYYLGDVDLSDGVEQKIAERSCCKLLGFLLHEFLHELLLQVR